MSQKAKNGLTLFLHLGCKGCHSGIAVGGLSMQKFPLRRIWSIDSIFDFQKTPDFPFENKGDFLGKDNRKLFRVPILRNVEHTSPYFHNGSVKDLKEAVRIMGLYQTDVKLNDAQLDEIVEFLNSLSGELVNYKMATH
ncbi:MAG: c-type cytochrome [Campylobacterota bacterium]|nr:c-type cytochrome [Campylobacterota bacterium]